MPASPPQDFLVRPPTLDDVEAVANLLNTCSRAEYGVDDYSAHEIKGEWEGPLFNLETDARLVFGPDGKLVGFMEFFDDPDGQVEHLETLVHVHPDYKRQDVGEYLLQIAEQRARQAILARSDIGTQRVVLKSSTWNVNEAARQRLEQAGFRKIRYTQRMEINLTEAPPAPQWPEGISVRSFVPGQDEQIVYELREAAFADMWGFISVPFDKWVYYLITMEEHFDPNLWFLAFEGERLVGHSLCLPRTNDDPHKGWVQNLAVAREGRKRGLGMALLLHSFGEFYRRGNQTAGLSVDSQSLTGANRLYERAGMHVVRQNDKYEKLMSDE